jgi:hypothetical protein
MRDALRFCSGARDMPYAATGRSSRAFSGNSEQKSNRSSNPLAVTSSTFVGPLHLRRYRSIHAYGMSSRMIRSTSSKGLPASAGRPRA